MQAAGVFPDSIAFTAILSACSSPGLLVEGLGCFSSMVLDYGIRPREEHYACIKGLITKERKLKEACVVIESMALRGNRGIWDAFLGACKVHGNMNYAEIASRKLLEIESE
ncbi:pentatricopeptide repeat-containing protein [Canna indica]|uniref:Pentatricopeptide repeat-containing protein n=1 Tax=Canna indica TaxID=4628 RepID=A0AAQ3KLY1_9LILI|nr:pentatricopeptide repeat-containing protein [Canna indica]